VDACAKSRELSTTQANSGIRYVRFVFVCVAILRSCCCQPMRGVKASLVSTTLLTTSWDRSVHYNSRLRHGYLIIDRLSRFGCGLMQVSQSATTTVPSTSRPSFEFSRVRTAVVQNTILSFPSPSIHVIRQLVIEHVCVRRFARQPDILDSLHG
jgi:hypothetical protein